MQSGDYEGALAAFDGALACCTGKITDLEIDICYYKAAAQYAAQDTEGALETYNAMIDYDGKNANAYYLRGCLKLGTGDTDGAKQDFADAVKYNHSDYELYINIYKNLAAYDLSEEGEAYLNDAFSIKGNDAELFNRNGDCETGEFVRLRFHLDRSVMFLFDDRLGDREAETGSFSDRFGGEERRIKFLFDLLRDSRAVVFDNQPYPVAVFCQSYLDGRTIRIFSDTFGFAEDSITGVVHQVENSAAEVLRAASPCMARSPFPVQRMRRSAFCPITLLY